MALPFLLGYARAADPSVRATILENYTHTCGYTRAWVDPTDPLLVWLLPDCPVDAVIASLKVNIANFVVAAYNNQLDQDMHRRVLAIISEVRDHAITWLNQHTTEEIALFIQQDKRLHDLIITELITQGAVQ